MERKIEDILIAQDEEDHDYQEIGSYISIIYIYIYIIYIIYIY